jgi:Protein of unknown function (DUF3014)
MSSSFDDGGGPPKTQLRSGGRARWIIVVVLAAVAVGVGAWLLTRGHGEVTTAQVPTPATPPEQPAAEALPPKDQTDPVVRETISQLCAAPGLAALLVSDDLVRRVVTAVDNVSRGEAPTSQLPSLAPSGPFKVVRHGRRLVVDPRGYQRWNRVTSVLAAVDMRRCAGVFAKLSPMFTRAYAEIGPRGRTFDDALSQAIKRLTAVPVPKGDLVVVQHVTYRYEDPTLEALPAADKQLLRLGPKNMQLVQQKLRELASALKLPEG